MEFQCSFSKAYHFRYRSLFRKFLISVKLSQKKCLKKYWLQKFKKALESEKNERITFQKNHIIQRTFNALKYHRNNQIKKKRLNYKIDIIFEKRLLKRTFKQLQKKIFSTKYAEIFRMEYNFRLSFL